MLWSNVISLWLCRVRSGPRLALSRDGVARGRGEAAAMTTESASKSPRRLLGVSRGDGVDLKCMF